MANTGKTAKEKREVAVHSSVDKTERENENSNKQGVAMRHRLHHSRPFLAPTVGVTTVHRPFPSMATMLGSGRGKESGSPKGPLGPRGLHTGTPSEESGKTIMIRRHETRYG